MNWLATATLWLALALGFSATPVLARDWPMPRVPADASLALIGDSMQVNGMPVRIYQFATRRSVDEVIKAFAAGVEGEPRRLSMPGPGERIAVGGRSGNFWLTVQIRFVGGMTVGTWSATPQFEGGAQRRLNKLPGFPEAASVLHRVDSFDDGKQSQLVVGLDPTGIDALAQSIDANLRAVGFAKQPFVGRNWHGSGEYVATYSRSREEIMVTLREESAGTSIIMNRLSALGGSP